MGLKRMLAGLGAGGASVETVLHDPNCRPGGTIAGICYLSGGNVDQTIEKVDLELVAKVEVEYSAGDSDGEYMTTMAFHKQQVTGTFQVQPGQKYDIPFQMQVPWETPITAVAGWSLKGMSVGVRTDVEIAKARDAGDVDAIAVHPLPAQERILAALDRLGFRFKSADLEKGHIPGSSMPFYQEIEYYPGPQFARAFNALELTFMSGPNSMDIVLEADKKGGMFTEGRDQLTRFTVPYDQIDADWEGQLTGVLQQMGQRRGWF